MGPPAASRRIASCHGMRASLYVPFVLLWALLMSACTSEKEQAQQAREVKEFDTFSVSGEIGRVVQSRASELVRVECPDTVDKIVRLGCEATASHPVTRRLRIKVVRTGDGDHPDYRVATKIFDKLGFEQSIRHNEETPTQGLSDVKCPELIEQKKGVRFVCKGEGIFGDAEHTRAYTVRVRAGFDDGGHVTILRYITCPPHCR